MNVHLDGNITFVEFRNFCLEYSSAMDFLGKITLGAYPEAPEPPLDLMRLKLEEEKAQ